MINILVWLLAFLMQAGLLGITMYSVCEFDFVPMSSILFFNKTIYVQLISLSDLENDFVNPHDASAALNKWTVSSLICE